MTLRLGRTGGHPACAFLLLLAVACLGAAGCGSGDDNVGPAIGGDAGDARAGDASVGDALAGDASGRDASVGDASAADARGIDADAAMDAKDANDATVVDATLASPEAGVAIAKPSLSAIDFGGVDCGGQATKTLTIDNPGTAQLAVTASVTGAGFAIAPNTPTSLEVAPGASGTLTLAASVLQTATAGSPGVGSLNLFTSDPNNVKVSIRLLATARGATLGLQQAGMGLNDPIIFPTTKVFTSTSTDFTLVNYGNAPTTVQVGAPTDSEFSLTPATPDGGVMLDGVLDPTTGKQTAWTTTVRFAPMSTGTKVPTATITTGGTTCGTSLPSISFEGEGTTGALTGSLSKLTFLANCGLTAPAPTGFTLKNTSPVDVNVTSATIAPPFTVNLLTALPLPISIPANGGMLPVVVTAPAFAPGTTAGVMPPALKGQGVQLIVHTDSTSTPTITVDLDEEPQGASLNFDTTSPGCATPNTTFSDFGKVVLLQASQPHEFCITNAGTLPASVNLFAAATGNADGGPPPFRINLANPITVPAGIGPSGGVVTPGSVQDSVTFAPVVANGSSASLSMTVDPATTVLCSPLPGQPAGQLTMLRGVGSGGGPVIAPTSLTFNAPCDGTTMPAAQAFTVQNAGNQDMNWWLSNVAGPGAARYTVTAVTSPSGTVSAQPGLLHLLHPGESSTVHVGVNGAIASGAQTAAPPPAMLAAQITVATDVQTDSPHVVSLSEIPVGDQLSVLVGSLAFGPFTVGSTTLPQTFLIRNDANPRSPVANVSLGLQGAGASAYSVTPPTASNLAPGGGMSTASVTFAPASAGSHPATLSFTTSDLVCAPLPAPIQLAGTGTQGLPVVSTNQLDFGLVHCGATGSSKTFTVSNQGTQLFNVTSMAFGPMAPGKTTSPFKTPVPAATTASPIPVGIGSTVTITVSPNAIPGLPAVVDPNDPSVYSDTLTLKTDAVGDTAHTINLLMQPQGAVITETQLATPWNFGTVGFGSIGTITSTIRNTGNATASVTLAEVAQSTIFALANSPTTVAAKDVTSIVGQFAPDAPNRTWNDQGRLVLTAPVLCAPPPAIWQPASMPGQWQTAPIPLLGASNSDSPVTFSGDLAFPATECGSGPPGAQHIVLTNTTSQTYEVTANLTLGRHYAVTISGTGDAGTEIQGLGGSATISVAPQTVQPGQGVVPGSAAYSDNLLVTIGNPSSAPVATFNFPVSWSLSGAVLSLPFGVGNHNAAGTAPFYLADSTLGGVLLISNSGNEAATVTFSPPSSLTVSPNPVSAQASSGAQPRLFSTSSAPPCPSQVGPNTTLTLNLSGPVCQPLQTPTVNVLSCTGTTP
jgi:hypothetical protein